MCHVRLTVRASSAGLQARCAVSDTPQGDTPLGIAIYMKQAATVEALFALGVTPESQVAVAARSVSSLCASVGPL